MSSEVCSTPIYVRLPDTIKDMYHNDSNGNLSPISIKRRSYMRGYYYLITNLYYILMILNL